jgi:hypothetical protein
MLAQRQQDTAELGSGQPFREIDSAHGRAKDCAGWLDGQHRK